MKDYKQFESFTIGEEEDVNYLKVSGHNRTCYRPLEDKSIMEEFPDYRFKPVSLMKGPATKSKSYARIPILIGYAMTIAGLVLLILLIVYSVEEGRYYDKVNWTDDWYEYSNTYEYWHWNHMGYLCVVMTATGVPIFSVGVVMLVLFYVLRRKHTPIQSIADYISTNKLLGKRKKLIIFVKNRKFGVMKKGLNKIVIPAQFDMLSWETKDFLMAKDNKMYFLIDKKGQRRTDAYDNLCWKEKGQILSAELNGQYFFVDIYGNRLS